MAGERQVHTSAADADAQTRRDAVEALFARRQGAYDNLDAAALAADYTEDAVIDSPFSGRHGKRHAEQNLRTVFAAFLDMKVVTEALVVEGNKVAQVAMIEGTNMGGLFGAEASGKTFRIPAAFFYEVRDGLIAYERRVYDFTGLLVQVGVLKAKPV